MCSMTRNVSLCRHCRMLALRRMLGIDKALIGARKQNLAMAGTGYIKLQENALANREL